MKIAALLLFLPCLGLGSPLVEELLARRPLEETEHQFRARHANISGVHMVEPVDEHGTAIVYTLSKKYFKYGVYLITAASAAVILVHTIVYWGGDKSNNNDCSQDKMTISEDHSPSRTHQISWKTETTGSNCKTTAITKTFNAAVTSAVDKLHQSGATHGCVTMWHKGTWVGRFTITPTGKTAGTVATICPTWNGHYDKTQY